MKKIITINKEVRIPNTDIILEKGDKIEVLIDEKETNDYYKKMKIKNMWMNKKKNMDYEMPVDSDMDNMEYTDEGEYEYYDDMEMKNMDIDLDKNVGEIDIEGDVVTKEMGMMNDEEYMDYMDYKNACMRKNMRYRKESKNRRTELTAYKVEFEDGNYLVTSMSDNVTLADAKKYYVGKYFNFGVEGDKMVKAVKVTPIRESKNRKREAEVDIKKIIKDLQGNFSGSNENQMQGLQLLKGLATSDEDIANEFMKKLDKATTEISKEVLGEKKEKRKKQEIIDYSKEMYASQVGEDKYIILYKDDGDIVTQIDANIYPIGSNLSTRYEHPNGIYLTLEDVMKLKLDIETI